MSTQSHVRAEIGCSGVHNNVAGNILDSLREESTRSWLLLSVPLDTNGGEGTTQDSWAAVAELLRSGFCRIVVNQTGLWISRAPDQLNDGSTFLVLSSRMDGR
jgi:hypothetical protein